MIIAEIPMRSLANFHYQYMDRQKNLYFYNQYQDRRMKNWHQFFNMKFMNPYLLYT